MVAAQDQAIHIILIDDDEVDAEAVARLLLRHHLPYQLTVFSDGRAAQAALVGAYDRKGLGEHCLILLDLNMPRMTGLEFLDWLRGQPDLAGAVVFVFSTSDDPADQRQAYQRQVAGYLAKASLGPGYAGLLPVLAAFEQRTGFPAS